MKPSIKNIVLAAAMLVSAALSIFLRPTQSIAEQSPKVDLDLMIPNRIGEWVMDTSVANQMVSPDVKVSLDKIYTQVLTRTYINGHGYRMMLSIPYGKNQSDGLAAHDPEGCYPSQGFRINSAEKGILRTALGDIPVRRMEATSGRRNEPVTYWFTVGNHAVNDGWERKKAQIGYALKGQTPDGFLVRASSIDIDKKNAFAQQASFLETLVQSLPNEFRTRFSGLPMQ